MPCIMHESLKLKMQLPSAIDVIFSRFLDSSRLCWHTELLTVVLDNLHTVQILFIIAY